MGAYPVRNFTVVTNELPEPPYPADLKANGWCPAQDIDRIITSDTWVLAEEDERPWLLRIWLESWRSVPVGTMPADRRMFARRIGCKVAFLESHAEILMRGWVLHADGNLYHNYIITQVQAMLATRSKNREKLKEWRKAQAEKTRCNQLQSQCNQLQDECNQLQTDCNQLVTGKYPVSNHYGQDRIGIKNKEEAKASLSEPADAASDRVTPCPHQDIIDLYHRVLPELPGIILSRWRGSDGETQLRTRWREDPRHQSLDFWERFFKTIRTSKHWMGDNERGWRADLRWVLKRNNFDKVLQRLVENLNLETAHG